MTDEDSSDASSISCPSSDDSSDEEIVVSLVVAMSTKVKSSPSTTPSKPLCLMAKSDKVRTFDDSSSVGPSSDQRGGEWSQSKKSTPRTTPRKHELKPKCRALGAYTLSPLSRIVQGYLAQYKPLTLGHDFEELAKASHAQTRRDVGEPDQDKIKRNFSRKLRTRGTKKRGETPTKRPRKNPQKYL